MKGNPLDLVKDVKVQLSVVLGDAQISVADFMALKEKSVLPLDQQLNEPVDILLDGKVVARGNLVAVDDQFGIQITELNNQ
jgi:flagellar motor switch protein FliN/FliY